MQYSNLGKSGLKVSRLCLGTMTYGSSTWRDWVLDEQKSRPFFKRALELGINFFDTANMYSNGLSEEVLGRAMRDFARRDEVVIATKVYFPMEDHPNSGGLSRKHIFHAIDDSLQRLGMDYVDLYQIHRWDYETPIEETMEALHDLVKMGKVRYLGASSMYAWQFAKAQYTAERYGWSKFISMQNHYNLIFREEERETIPLCLDMGVGVIPWSPLARGFLAGNRTVKKTGPTKRAKSDSYAHNMYYHHSDFEVLERVTAFAKEKGFSAPQVALAWLLRKPAVVSPIIGASKLEYLDEAVGALEIKLSLEERAHLEELYQPHHMVTFGMDHGIK